MITKYLRSHFDYNYESEQHAHSICLPVLAADKRIPDNYPNVYSLLAVRHGYLVYEKYYQGMDANSANPIYSVTKSVMSAPDGHPRFRLSSLYPSYFIFLAV